MFSKPLGFKIKLTALPIFYIKTLAGESNKNCHGCGLHPIRFSFITDLKPVLLLYNESSLKKINVLSAEKSHL